MFSLAINFPTQKFLQSQSKVGILAWLGFISLIVHIGILVLFIKVLGWGTTGAAAAYDISAWGVALSQMVYVVGWCQEGWRGLSWLAFKDLWAFVKLSFASAIMLCLEVWYFMTLIVLTGHLDNPVIAVGSLSICVEMQKAVSKLASLLGITMILNSVQPVISGVAVGGGWQALVAYINLFCYYIIGLPLGFLLGYKLGYRVEGIWIGMICGTMLQTMILVYIIYKTNWNKEVEQASERMRKWTGQELVITAT
ncbi:unnamed protein product [Lupinus luteus]|uniref:Uncharacterized protein n=1 Tax=Lupinus luteus TaxID=3873 RepID=A0AAV1W883_LUPLU